MKGIAYVEVVERQFAGRVFTIARCKSCGYTGGEYIDDPKKTIAAAKRHGKVCKELLADDDGGAEVDAAIAAAKAVKAS
jgi:hypothetical protein